MAQTGRVLKVSYDQNDRGGSWSAGRKLASGPVAPTVTRYCASLRRTRTDRDACPLCSLLVAALPFGGVLAAPAKSKNARVTLVYQRELSNVPGKSIKGGVAIRSQVNDGPVTTYEAGQSFSELPGEHHGVSANAGETKRAKLLAVFVVDTNETELTIPFGN
jgi:hypothetical protein